MKICLCKTSWLEYKNFIIGNEYFYEFNNDVGLYRVYNENLEGYWFNENDMEDWFTIY